MDGQWSIILSEHIWLFVHSFCFRSRSDEWCAIEPRGEGLGGGGRGQGGAQGAKGASNTLSAADAGHRRHIIALGLIALSADTVLCRVGVGGVRENVISVGVEWAWYRGDVDF